MSIFYCNGSPGLSSVYAPVANSSAWRGFAPEHPVLLSNAQATPVMGADGVVHVFLTIESGELPDVLLDATSSAAGSVDIVTPGDTAQLTIPARASASLSSDGVYLELSGVAQGAIVNTGISDQLYATLAVLLSPDFALIVSESRTIW